MRMHEREYTPFREIKALNYTTEGRKILKVTRRGWQRGTLSLQSQRWRVKFTRSSNVSEKGVIR